MKNRAIMMLGTAALLAPCLILLGCSSSGGDDPAGGGTGGVSGGGGSNGAAAYIPVGSQCPSTVKNKGACNVATDQPCFNTCGPLKSGNKNCTCVAGAWSCPTCGFDPAGMYSCFVKPAASMACPIDPANPDPSGMNLPKSGDACSIPTCQPCGSSSSNAYRDSGGVPKIGFCVCSAATDGQYSCASIAEWPPV